MYVKEMFSNTEESNAHKCEDSSINYNRNNNNSLNSCYVPLPPLLLNTAGLEIYLHNLNEKLQHDLAHLKKEISTSREEVTAVFVNVNQMKKYLSAQATTEMQGVISETSNLLQELQKSSNVNLESKFDSNTVLPSIKENDKTKDNSTSVNKWSMHEGITSNTNIADVVSSVDGAIGKDNLEPVDTFEGMMMIAKELMEENRELRKALLKSAEMNEETKRLHTQLYFNLAQSNERMSKFQRDFNKLSQWLGTFNMFDMPAESSSMNNTDVLADWQSSNNNCICDQNDDNNNSDYDNSYGTNATIMKMKMKMMNKSAQDVDAKENQTANESQELNLPSPEEVETFLARSPLLLTFRRILLRDLGLRLAHNTEVQSRDVGQTISNIKQNLNDCVTPQHVRAMINSTQDNKANELMRNFADRLKIIETNYVTREEYVSSIGTKADNLMMPVKADSSVVNALERQLNDRCVDLEERVAYFEAERNELRKIVKALLNEHQRSALELSEATQHDTSYSKSTGNNLHSSPNVLFLPYHTASVNAESHRSPLISIHNVNSNNNNNNNNNVMSSNNIVNEGQLYRLIHNDKSSYETLKGKPEFVTAKVSSTLSTSAPMPSSLQSRSKHSYSPSRFASVSPSSMKQQNTSPHNVSEPNLKYFAEELNREHVESLPALPFARTSR